MPVNRKIWGDAFSPDHAPSGWSCPTCSGGYLILAKDSLRFEEGTLSRGAHHEDWFDPEHADLRFIALLQCNNDKCKEFLAVSGKGSYTQSMHDDGNDWKWVEYFEPLSVVPPVHFITLPSNMPGRVSDQLVLSFSTLWSSPAASATHIRIGIENLLDALRIPRARRIKSVRMQRLSLHERIKQLEPRRRDLAEALFAIKWVGNAASHLGDLTRTDLFDAYDILEHVLEELYVRNREATRKLIREINSKRGPRTKRVKMI